MAFKLKVDDSVWKKMKKELLKANQMEVQVGIVEPTNYGSDNDNLSVAQVWQWQEEGLPAQNIPPRPAIRVGFMAPVKSGSYNALFVESMQRIAEGKSTFKQEYTRIGTKARTDLKKAVADWDTPPNAPYTVAEKGFNDPLISSGKLYNEIDYKINNRGSD
ncbi:MAG: hypothetical protein EOO06_00665 [Chitinophagaceae bacterium]|nr:MAG: hypothetical protein EOO06_00665 [Chitinophagaceae bacterium]